MEISEYQEKAMSTCTESCNNFSYMFINLVGELGEFASKVGKSIRKGHMVIIDNKLMVTPEGMKSDDGPNFDMLMAEIGDIMWQLSGLCEVLGYPLNHIAEKNLEKLASRKERNVIIGDGDNR